MSLNEILDRLPPSADLKRIHDRLRFKRLQYEDHHKFECTYPETGNLSRHVYKKQMGFFEAGTRYLERGLLGGNRSGKSTTAGFELTCHLTGRYPHWWQGRRFDRAITAWAAGDDSKSVREAAQTVLLGAPGKPGTGMIPIDAIVGQSRKMGVADAVDSVLVKHVSGGTSRLVFKAYDQRRVSFQGARVDVGWCDEEPPYDVYSEFKTRLLSTVPGEPSGIMMATFTPLQGLSQVVLQFLPDGGKPKPGHDKYVVFVGWEDAPHISPQERAEMEKTYLPHEREARTKGVPSLGAGAVYPVPESDVVVSLKDLPPSWRDFREAISGGTYVPPWFRRCYGLDVGWNRTAAVWGALDYETDVLYIYQEHYQSHAEPAVHAQAIRAKGRWIPGVIDPASRGRGQHDGEQLLSMYRELGLNVEVADNAVESGIYAVWERLASGRLKVFDHCTNWLAEFRVYRRDDKGKIVKPVTVDHSQPGDHLMDATRYLVMSGLQRAVPKPVDQLRDRDWPAGVRTDANQYTSTYDPLEYGRQ